MFLLNLGSRSKILEDFSHLNGYIYLPSLVHSESINPKDEYQKRLIDPQLYLATLDSQKCKKTCSRLATYPWFNIEGIPNREDSKNLTEWKKKVEKITPEKWTSQIPKDISSSVKSALKFQENNNCSHLILPSPLITNREDELSEQMEWLDECLKHIEDGVYFEPILATIAIDETVLNEQGFNPLGFVDTILDLYTSREGIDGFYIVINQTYSGHPFETNKIVNKMYLHLTKALSDYGCSNIILNFADIFSNVCLGFGATAFASGPSQKMRKLSHKALEDSNGGKGPLPHYYSHNIVSEILTETELTKITNQKLFKRVKDDTQFSRMLNKAIEKGRDASTIQAWAESRNNIKISSRHFLERMFIEAEKVKSGSIDKDYLIEWLENSEMYRAIIEKKVGESNFPKRSAPIEDWVEVIQEVED